MKNIKSTTRGIHNGAVTHHHDQSMWSVNFNTKNIKNRIIPIPIPPLFAELFSLILSIN